MYQIVAKIKKLGIVPVVKLDHEADAQPLAKALCEGGLPCAEITFRTGAAAKAIRIMTESYPDMLVGAGTVLTTEQVDKAMEAGAKFIVSPGLNPRIVTYCREKGITMTPGTANPSDVEAAIELGLETVKFFPAEAAGGLAMIKAMSAPYVNMTFMPTGGINENNLNDYLDFPKIIACGGSWMVSDALIKAGDFDKIREITKKAVAHMLGFKLCHIGINASDEKEADSVAGAFEKLFGFPKTAGVSSIFAGSAIEVMKTPYLGMHGHIAIQTNYLERAIFHLELQGFVLDRNTAEYDKENNMTAVYFKDQIGGFALHLIQKK